MAQTAQRMDCLFQHWYQQQCPTRALPLRQRQWPTAPQRRGRLLHWAARVVTALLLLLLLLLLLHAAILECLELPRHCPRPLQCRWVRPVDPARH